MTDQFHVDVKVGDTVIWAPYKFLYIGKVLSFTKGGNIRVKMYRREVGEFVPNGETLIRTWRFMVIPLELPE